MIHKHISLGRMLIRTFMVALSILLMTMPAFSQSKKSDSFFGKGVDLYNKGLYQEAITCFEKVVELDKKDIPEDSYRAGYGCSWLANCHYKLGNISKAKTVSYNDYQFEPVDRRLTIESDKEADLANQCYKKNNLEEAIQHATKCLSMEKSVLGENSLHCVGSYLTLGNFYLELGDSNNAIENFNNGLSIIEDLGIENSMYNFNLLGGKIYVHLFNNDTQSALLEIHSLESIVEYEKIENYDDNPTAVVDLFYARTYIQCQSYTLAADHAIKAFNNLINIYNPNEEEQFRTLCDSYTLLCMLDRYEEAKPLVAKAIDTIILKGGSNKHLGVFYSYLGECTNNPDDYKKSLELLANVIDEDFRDMYYSTECNLAHIYELENAVTDAINLYQEVCNYYSENNPNHTVYRQALSSLGDLYENLGFYEKANEAYSSVLSSFNGDKTNPDYALSFMRWIPIYFKYSMVTGLYSDGSGFNEGYQLMNDLNDLMGNLSINSLLNKGINIVTVANVMIPFFQVLTQISVATQSIPCSLIEIGLSQLTYDYLIPSCSENNTTTHLAKSLLAHTKYLLGKYDDSIALMNEIISSCKRFDLPYDNYLHDLGYIQYDSGDKAGAYENFKIGFDFNKNNILSGYRWMTTEERDNLTRTHRGNLDNMPHYAAITPEDSRYAELGYNALLFTKGLLLNSSIELSRLLQEEGDNSTLNLLNQWRKKNQEYQNAMQKGDYIKAKSLKIQADVIERQLVDTSKTYGDYTEGLTVDYKEVQNGLNEGDIAIEFFSYQNDAKSRMYGAIILTKNDVPKYIPVGLDKDWGKLIDECYSDERLFNSLFANLKPYLPKMDRGNIYFAADGLLHTIAIENLPGSEPYNFRRLSSTREIALRRGFSSPVSDIAVIGGVKYGIGKLAEYYNEDGSGYRESLDFLSYLPGTKIEADKVENIFAPKKNVSKFIEDKATESNFKNFSGKGIGLLHIATHGFFNQPLNVNNQAAHETEAMSSSGLYFAGAQNTLWGELERNMKEDGILSAQEISSLDLRGLRLAVLSACETGKGSVGPDGVFGLQRGFKQAGAEGLMMSLWKVDDKATQILMEEFYKNLSSGSDQYSALREAQNVVRKDYPDPRYWAAFILIDAIRELKL